MTGLSIRCGTLVRLGYHRMAFLAARIELESSRPLQLVGRKEARPDSEIGSRPCGKFLRRQFPPGLIGDVPSRCHEQIVILRLRRDQTMGEVRGRLLSDYDKESCAPQVRQ